MQEGKCKGAVMEGESVWKNMKKKNEAEASGLEDEDWKTLRRIMRYISSCGLEKTEMETVRKEIIGMAQEARLRGKGLREIIGEEERKFADEILRAATGKSMGKGRGQVKGAAVCYIVYGAAFLWILGIWEVNHLLGVLSYEDTGGIITELFSDELGVSRWILGMMAFAGFSLAGGIWSLWHCGDRKRRTKQKGFGIIMLFAFIIKAGVLIGMASGWITVFAMLEWKFSLFGTVTIAGLFVSGLYLSGAAENKKE